MLQRPHRTKPQKVRAACSLAEGFHHRMNLVLKNGVPGDVCVWQGMNPITKKWYINHDRAIEWIDGRLVKIQIATDITDRKRAEEELKKSEERYREYFEGNICGTYIADAEGQLVTCNKEYLKIFGFDRTQDAKATPILNHYKDPNDRIKFLDALKKNKRVTGYELNLKRVDGTSIKLVENSSGTFDEKGSLIEIRGFLLDITDHRKLENQLKRAQKMEAIGTLAGGIAHDFNNILSSIFGYLQLVEYNLNEPEKAKNYLRKLDNGAQRASALIQQILAFSRQTEYRKLNVSVFVLVKEVLKLLHSSIPANIVIHSNIVSEAKIKADPTQIHQVIMNLCTNAYHAMSNTGGELRIGLHDIAISEQESIPDLNRWPGKYIRLEVSDTGSGMDEETMSKIFDPYFTTKDIERNPVRG